MESKVNYTIVGIFVLTLLTAIILGIIWLSSGLSIEHYKIYKVRMNESVKGLNLDASVEFNGVHVGSVKGINIDHHYPQLVEILLRIKKDTPITVGTRAKLDIKALSGIASIELVDKGTDLTPLHTQKGELYPIIPTTPSLLVRLEEIVTKFGDNFNQISQAIRSLLSEENIRLMQQTLHAGQQMMMSGKNTLQLIDTKIIPDAHRTLKNIDTVTHDLSTLSTEIEQNPSVLIRGKKEAPLGPGEK